MPRLPSLVLAVAVITGAPASAEPLIIASWNIAHLRDQNGEGPVSRQDVDYTRLAKYATKLGAHVVALQEVENEAAARRVFAAGEYQLFVEGQNNPQRTGFAVKNGLAVVNNGDFVALALDGSVRRGVDITVTVAGQPVRLLSVHLKSGCFEVPLSTPGNDCAKLLQQVPVLEGWIDQRTQEDVPFAILGDWNRRFDAEPGQEFWREIDDGLPAPLDLLRVTEGVEAHCPSAPGFDEFIDHIVLDEQTARFVVEGSFSQLQYDSENAAFFAKLSDHCPIRVTLEVAEEEPVVIGRNEEIRQLLSEIMQRMDRVRQLLGED
jgi:endonuclease/exonuclease/phosphatase family metal-dependent hydrolase